MIAYSCVFVYACFHAWTCVCTVVYKSRICVCIFMCDCACECVFCVSFFVCVCK